MSSSKCEPEASGLPFSEALAENIRDVYDRVFRQNKAGLIIIDGGVGEGKTKIMSISRLFTFNPTQEMTNPSEATLFREGGKTQYIDEAEKIFYES